MANESSTDYGPLAGLIGTWRGDEGMDVSPEPDGREDSPYYETIVFEPAGDTDNAETQELAVVRYHLFVQRKSNDAIFHDQVGYWTWEPATDGIVQSLVIPRGVCVLAGGGYERDETGAVKLSVRAAHGDPDWGVVQSPFMRDNARTTAFVHELTVSGDQLSYSETTSLEIYGRTFEHTDQNVLRKQ